MKKILKVLAWVLGVLLVIIITSPFWIFPVARFAANTITPGIIGADFHLGDLGFEYSDGHFHVGDLHIGNPKGYEGSAKGKNAVDFGGLSVKLDPDTLTSDTIHIYSIDITDFVINTDITGKNFRMIAANASGEKAPETAESQPQVVEVKHEPVQPTEGTAASSAKSQGKKVIIDRFTITGTSVDFGYGPVTVGKYEFKDIGKDKGGVSYDEAYAETMGKLDETIEKLRASAEKVSELSKQTLESLKTKASKIDLKNVKLDDKTKEKLDKASKKLEKLGKNLNLFD